MTTEKKAVWVVFRPTEPVNLKKVPEKYGCRPEVVRVLDIGVILAKEMVTQEENSWLAKD